MNTELKTEKTAEIIAETIRKKKIRRMKLWRG